MNTFIPENYSPKISLYDTQTAIGLIKRMFEDRLAAALNLKRVTAPLFLDPSTGLNDNLNGVERPVGFDIANSAMTAEVVQSLAKWKRMALGKYGFKAGEGIYTDMNAIRRDEILDNIHSVYTDQWDWEKVILRSDRNFDYLKSVVRSIVSAVADTNEALKAVFPVLTTFINPVCTFITSQELEDMYPGLTVKQRENEITRKHGSVFIMQIGGKLKSGKIHDGRAPDYDDWNLNGDIFFWDELLGIALEISSMGIRVDEKSLDLQLTAAGADDRRNLDFHKKLLAGELPLTIGGGIGQSRLCMLLLEKAHIGEVQVSVWDEETVGACSGTKISLL